MDEVKFNNRNYRATWEVLQVFRSFGRVTPLMKIAIKTLGCRANRSDSDRLVCLLREKFGDVRVCDDTPDVCFVNTCTVTHVADRKSRAAIVELRKKYPDSIVIVFGCGIKVAFDMFSNIKGVDLAAKSYDEILEFLSEKKFNDSGSDDEVLSRTRATIKVQDGCNNFCSYCIIPFARGREKSVKASDVLKDVSNVVRDGGKEIVLTGINIGNYRDKDLNLAQLIMKILDETKIARLRLSSIEPQNFVDEFRILLTDNRYSSRFCPHFHMSLQSGSDSVLSAMRRHYSTSLYKKVAQELKKLRPEVALTTDVIVGFPGESEIDFKKTCEFVREIGFAKIHVFPYSKRAGTKAALMDGQIDEKIKNYRAKKLGEIAEELRTDFFAENIGKTYPVLFERKSVRGVCTGFTPNYIKVVIKSSDDLFNKILDVKISGITKTALASGILV